MSRIFVALLVFLFTPGICTAAHTQDREGGPAYAVVAGTELIADIVRDLLRHRVNLLTLIPASSCPGHHDIRASDMAFFTGADMAIIHAWQKNYPGIDEAVAAARLPERSVKTVAGSGSLLVPENQIRASRTVAEFLFSLPGVDRAAIEQSLNRRIARIAALDAECRTLLAPYAGTAALSAFMQEEFVRWAGMDVIAAYGRAEDLSPGKAMELTARGRKAGARIVVDNLQSGAEAGLALAGEMAAAHVTFSNFPGNAAETGTYESLVRHNVALLSAALEQSKPALDGVNGQ